LIVEAAVRHLLEPQNLTRIIQDPVCREIFVLWRAGREVDILYRYNHNWPWGRASGDVALGPQFQGGHPKYVHYRYIVYVYGLSNCQGPLAQQRRVAGLSKGRGLSSSAFGIHVKPSPAGKSAGTHGHANRDSLNLESSRGGDARRDHARCETQASASAPYECDPVIQYAPKPSCR